jgi:dihydrofolate reductase
MRRAHMTRVTSTATTALLGRKNYQGFTGLLAHGRRGRGRAPADREFSRWLNTVEKVVLSTTLSTADWDNSRITSDDTVTVVKQLRQHGGGDIVVLASASVIRPRGGRRAGPCPWSA